MRKRRSPKKSQQKVITVAKEHKAHPTSLEFSMMLVILLAILLFGKTAALLMEW